MATDLTPERIVDLLGLAPHPEGGFFAPTWSAAEAIPGGALPSRYGASRVHGTSIHFLLTPEGFSAFHRLKSDEVWHFHLGAAVEILLLDRDGSGRLVRLGPDLEAGERPQAVVQRGTWQAARVAAGGRFSLVGCTMAPGFDVQDFELARPHELLAAYPAHAAWIRALTRPATD